MTHPRLLVRHLLITAIVLFFILMAVPARAETIRGRVVDPQAQPVRGADVLISQRDVVVATAKTDADGRFGPVTLPAGSYDVRAAASGLGADQHVTIAAGATLDLKIAMALTAVRESVVVSAAQVDLPLSRAPGSVTVISRDELELRQTQTATDALRGVAGFGVVMSGSQGGVTSIFPRGGESNYTLMLVDGIVQNGFGGDFDAAHLSTADIERIEVVRGPQSALFGSGAIGGVVHIITRYGGPNRGQFLFEGGSDHARRVGLSGAGSSGPWRWSGAVDNVHTDGDTRVFPSAGGRVSNAFYRRLGGSGSLGWSAKPSLTARLDVRLGRSDRGSPGAYGSDPLDLFNAFGGLDTKSHGTTNTTEVAGTVVIGDGTRLRHHIQGTWAGLKSAFFSLYDLQHPSSNDTHRASGRYQLDFEAGRVGVSAGVEALQERADNTYITGGDAGQQVPVKRRTAGVFVEGRTGVAAQGSFTLGVRLDSIQRGALPSDPAGFSGRPALGDGTVWSTNPRVTFGWLFGRPDGRHWTRVRTSAGTGIRAPNAFELSYTDNPALKPERSRSIEAGIEQALAGPALVAEVTGFHNRYDDLIVTIGSSFTGASRYRTDNIANALSRGVEIGVRWRAAHGISARVAGTILRTKILGADHAPNVAGKSIYQVGDPLVRRPREQGFFELSWTGRRATAFLSVTGRGAMLDAEPNLATTVYSNRGYTAVALGGSLKAGGGVEVIGRIENALNAAYEEAFGYPALGRAVWVGLRIAANR